MRTTRNPGTQSCMTYSQLLKILGSTNMSPEQLAPLFGVSNMTIRRWSKERPGKLIPKAHRALVFDGIYQLIISGHLQADDFGVQEILAKGPHLSIQAALQGMGISAADLHSEGSQQDRMTELLNRIGLSPKHRDEVNESHAKIAGFKKMGADWKRMITSLVGVVKSPRLTLTDKLVAYGALFYLICPFDMIPDSIPVFGLMDDFAILAMAVSYYGLRKKTETPAGTLP